MITDRHLAALPPPIQARDRAPAPRHPSESPPTVGTTCDGPTPAQFVGPNPMLDWLGWWTYLVIVAGPGFGFIAEAECLPRRPAPPRNP